jgi:hypothetical protein
MEGLKVNESGFLWPEEEKLLWHVLCLNEEAIAFDESEKGRFKDLYSSPYIIPTIEHTPWQEKNIPIPPGIWDKVIKLLKEKIAAGTYETTQLAYASKWFCMLKKNGSLHIVHDLQCLNSVTIRDVGLLPEPDEFIASCAGASIYSVFDLFLEYDSHTMDKKLRDLAAFNTPLGQLRLTGLPMGCTNTVPEFQSCMSFIRNPESPRVSTPFINDIPVCGPRTRYEQADRCEELSGNLGVRRFVWEHALDVNQILCRVNH